MRRGELTVFFSLIFILILALLCTMAEYSRKQVVRMQLQTAVNAACESQFAQYDNELLNRFKVFFFEGPSMGNGIFNRDGLIYEISSDMNDMLHPENEIYGNYADFFNILLDDGTVNSIAFATDDEGMVYRQQAIMSMKDRYGIAYAESLLNDSVLLNGNIEEGNNYKKSETDNKQILSDLQEQKSEIDKENEAAAKEAEKHKNPAAVIEVQKNIGILELVKPNNFEISNKQLDFSTLPSKRKLNKGAGCKSYSSDLLSKVLFNEYLMEMFSCADDADVHNKTQTCYQIEYLLSGKEHDADNLKSVVDNLLLIREGANFTYLLTDYAKVAEAEAMATLLVGYTGLVPLIEATKYAILLSWAYAESVQDIKRLLAGKKVAIIKNSANWQLALSNISNATSQTLKDDSDGITYKHYLRLLLLIETQENLALRCIDLVEMIMRSNELYLDFRLDLMISKLSVVIKAHSDSIFYTLPFMRNYNWSSINDYEIKRDFSYEMWQ